MVNFMVATMRGGEAVGMTAVDAGSDVLAALAYAGRPIRLGRKLVDPLASWLLVTHIASGRTSEFLFA